MATTEKTSPRRKIVGLLLPNEVLTQCIARVPLSSQAAMKLISKNMRTFITGGEIFDVRSKLNVKETSILVGLKSDENNALNWYALMKKFRNDEYLLRPVPFPVPLISGKEALVAAGNSLGTW